MSNQLASILALVFGCLGVLVCVAAIVGIWMVHGRISNATTRVFAAVDDAVGFVDERVEMTRLRIVDLKITVDELEEGLTNRLKTESIELFVQQYKVEERAGQVSDGLEQAQHWIAVAESSNELLRSILQTAAESGFDVSTGASDRLEKELQTVKKHVGIASESVERIRSWSRDVTQGESIAHEAIKWVGRLALTLTSVDESCERLRGKIDELRQSLNAKHAEIRRTIAWVAVGITFLMLWMAAGQAAMCYLGFSYLRQLQS